jgi:hypothetical protein
MCKFKRFIETLRGSSIKETNSEKVGSPRIKIQMKLEDEGATWDRFREKAGNSTVTKK